MTIGRLVTWTMVWLGGWALFFIRPAEHSGLGSVLLLAVALVMATPREWKDVSLRAGALALTLSVGGFLLLVFVLPPSYSWRFPENPRLLAGLEALGGLIASFGIGVVAGRFVRDHAGAV